MPRGNACRYAQQDRPKLPNRAAFDGGCATEDTDTMNTAEIIIPIPRPVPQRVRAPATGMTGTVLDVDVEGFVYWVGDDRSVHFSKADWLEVLR